MKKVLTLKKKILFFIVKVYEWFQRELSLIRGEKVLHSIIHQGENCIIHGNVTIHSIDDFSMGNNVRIGSGGFFHSIGGISIGDNTQLSRNILIYSGNHNIEGDAIPYDCEYVLKPVKIGCSVWIGMNVIITPGVTIGDGAVIGMGSVVSKSVPAGAIVVGAEQRIVKYRDLERFNKNKNDGNLFAKLWPNK